MPLTSRLAGSVFSELQFSNMPFTSVNAEGFSNANPSGSAASDEHPLNILSARIMFFGILNPSGSDVRLEQPANIDCAFSTASGSKNEGGSSLMGVLLNMNEVFSTVGGRANPLGREVILHPSSIEATSTTFSGSVRPAGKLSTAQLRNRPFKLVT